MEATGSRPLTVAAWAEAYLTELLNHGREESTAKAYRDRLGWFGEWLAAVDVRLEEVTRDTVEQWISDMRARGISPKHRANCVGAVRCFFSWLADERGALPRNPLARFRPMKIPKKLPQVLEVSDVLRLIDAARTPRERVIVELFYGSGIRKAELLGLDLPDVDLAGERVLIRGKGGRERYQPISPQAAAAIREWLPLRAEILQRRKRGRLDALLVTREGRIGRQTILNTVHQLAERAGLDRRVYPHLLRHCFATHLLNGGANLRQVQELMGHARLGTTEIYTHVARGEAEGAYRRAHPRAAMAPGAAPAPASPPASPAPAGASSSPDSAGASGTGSSKPAATASPE